MSFGWSMRGQALNASFVLQSIGLTQVSATPSTTWSGSRCRRIQDSEIYLGTFNMAELTSHSPKTPHNPSISGQKGGEATLSRHGINHFRYAGQKGGDALVTKYGRDHFIALG